MYDVAFPSLSVITKYFKIKIAVILKVLLQYCVIEGSCIWWPLCLVRADLIVSHLYGGFHPFIMSVWQQKRNILRWAALEFIRAHYDNQPQQQHDKRVHGIIVIYCYTLWVIIISWQYQTLTTRVENLTRDVC